MDSRLLARALACGALCIGFGCASKPGAASATESGSSGEVGTSSTGADGSTGVQSSTGGSSGGDPTEATTGGATSGVNTTGDGTTGDGTTGDGSSGGSTTGQSPWPIESCFQIQVDAGVVEGKTPLGDLTLQFGAYDPDGCFGQIDSLVVYLFEDVPVLDQAVLLGPQTTRLTVELLDPAWQGNWVGEGPVHVILHVPGAMDVEAAGLLKVSAINDIWLTGALDVTAPGWDLHGSFIVASCMELSGFTICE